ncbi:MAG: ComEC/Rec2 family competence protein [Solirubrobacterales bacterium]
MPPRQLLLPFLLTAAAVALALTHAGEIRDRAERALGKGMPTREAALARGFVLGEDEQVDERTTDDFRRSGLSHLLAVSGQNVALLALLALPVLAALGMPLRTRLVWMLGLIVVYVPLAGAGPSIQRAAIMGALSVLATLAGRRSSRLYALVIAAVALLAVEPRIVTDVGWQLSFTAVLGIVIFAAPLRTALGGRLGTRGWRRPLVDGAAMTIAATIATAPLIAFHFEAVSILTLVANLLALPAVAPAMWLGMLAAAAGQVPGFPVEALNAVNALLLAYIAQVAAWCSRPSWAYPHLRLGIGGLIAAYAAIGAAAVLITRFRRLRLPVVPRGRLHGPAALALVVVLLALAWPAGGGAEQALGPPAGLRVSILDVGQGDSILLQPRGAPALLVDGGPPGEGLEGELRAAGVDRLGAAIVTHAESDHASGIRELLGTMPVGQVLFGAPDPVTLAAAAAAEVPRRRVVRGSELRSGDLRLDVLWPPAELLTRSTRDEDPNRLAVVMLARWGRFSMLLTADAEAESVPLDPGPIDVLKVAHHGSEDAGLGDLLDRLRPRLAVISVGAGNPFGHPTAAVLSALAGHGVRTLRTDRDGTVVLEVAGASIEVDGEG